MDGISIIRRVGSKEMKNSDLLQLLDDLRSLPAETEVVEFKEAKGNFGFSGMYLTQVAIFSLARGRTLLTVGFNPRYGIPRPQVPQGTTLYFPSADAYSRMKCRPMRDLYALRPCRGLKPTVNKMSSRAGLFQTCVKYIPLPDYDVSADKVKVTIIGKILDMDYARLLAKNPDLSLDDIILLDKVQKRKNLPVEAIRYLRERKLIEGRKNNYYISYQVAKPTEDERLISEYVTNKSFDDKYFKNLIVEYIAKQGKTRRRAIDNLVIPKLSTVLSDKQKKIKVTNFLSALRMNGKIICTSFGVWEVKQV